ncbi:MarR family winged helix-turn-helix transcriptional regulator [Devosia pacifica]|nr:MarR family transcriptional regulator [Devosia pacifica]
MRIGEALQDFLRNVEAARDQAAREQNLHPTDFACIGYLFRVGVPVSPKQIISRMNLSSGSGTALLDRLQSLGYTRRLPNPDDRRSVLIELDQRAAAEPLKRYLELEESYRRATDQFSDEDLEVIAEFVSKISTLTSET